MVTIVVPLDGSPVAEQAIGPAHTLAKVLQARLLLVHVFESPPVGASGSADRRLATTYLDGVAADVAGSVPVATRLLFGDPATALLQLAGELPHAILALCTHGRSGVSRAIFGSVTDHLVRHATVPILVVRRAGTAATSFERVLVPLDGSDLAEAAVPLATDLVQRTGAVLALARVAEVYPVPTAGAAATLPHPGDEELLAELSEQSERKARYYLESVAQDLCQLGYEATWEVRVGRPATELQRVVESIQADLVVMSTHGRGGVRRWALGSVTTELVLSGVAPVLVIPPRAVGARL